MDPIKNPYAPGAGTQPHELAGRDELLEKVRIAVERTRLMRPSKSVLMVGLRGVGKTVLLDRMKESAENAGIITMRIEAPENRSLPSILAPELRVALLKLSRVERAKDYAQRALRGLAGFVSAIKVKYEDVSVGLDFAPEAGLADNGDLEHDLPALLEVAGVAAREANTALAIFIDELQYVAEDEIAALITAVHRTNQKKLPVILVGAGLPQLRGKTGNAKSYAERLFTFPMVGPLNESEAKRAIEKPAKDEEVDYKPAASKKIVDATEGYPYFLQEWGNHVWAVADDSPITPDDVDNATDQAIAALDESFFRVRFDRLTPSEKTYLRAMAELGAGPHRSGDIAECLRRNVSSVAPTRSNLISKGMVWSPHHGDTAFTVPMFDQFMKRIMPGDEWQD